MSLLRILIYEKNFHRAAGLREILESAGYLVKTAFYAEEAESAVKNERFDMVIAGFDGFPIPHALENTKIVISSPDGKYHELDSLARRYSASCIIYPYDAGRVIAQIKRTLEEKTYLAAAPPEPLNTQRLLPEIVGDSPVIRKVRETILIAARVPSPVLILGETGTGKELVAKGLHSLGPKSKGPLVPLNCAAMPESLLESELFGHEKGAFTGAIRRRAGKFESAHTGTLFLDEVGDMSQTLQVKLLRVLESGSFYRIGGEEEVKVDVKIICATNRNIFELAENGAFRRDLLYRINVISIDLPPLRERKDDIPLLARHFLDLYSKNYGKVFRGLTERALKTMTEYLWPGNVRQLQYSMERAVIENSGGKIDTIDFGVPSPAVSELPDMARLAELDFTEMKKEVLAFYEKGYIAAVLGKTGGSIQKASSLSGVDRKTFYRKMKEHGIDKNDFK
ncbi:MAG: Fis family transcriptional regulator [bacterium]|nr:MAG: Fis family transcriptional regulator [bacterium]